ncbi:MAG TPA: hypothetical protein VGV12_10610 [Gemmatimonadales bacterium]|nr:hypothetical protein [Gemmatimonadales bacterium]
MMHRLTVMMPGNIQPIERGARFADPLNQALKAEGIGETGDEGTHMGIVGGSVVVVAADIEVSVTDLGRGLAMIRRVLRAAEAPAGTTITEHAATKVVHQL